MADRSSARLFGEIFKLIDAEVSGIQGRSLLAIKFWRMSRGYDFCDDQMMADDALMRLELAAPGIDPRYPEDGPVMQYGPRGDRR